jgi:hypothetical protein
LGIGGGFYSVREKLNTEGAETCARRPLGRLGQVGDFFVEMSEGGFKGFAVIGVGGGNQVVGDAGARELQLLDVLLAELVLSTLWVAFR